MPSRAAPRSWNTLWSVYRVHLLQSTPAQENSDVMLWTKACGGSRHRTPTISPALDSSGGRKSVCAPSGQRSTCSIPRPGETIASWPNFRSRVLLCRGRQHSERGYKRRRCATAYSTFPARSQLGNGAMCWHEKACPALPGKSSAALRLCLARRQWPWATPAGSGSWHDAWRSKTTRG